MKQQFMYFQGQFMILWYIVQNTEDTNDKHKQGDSKIITLY